jgi:hypothetical protein
MFFQVLLFFRFKCSDKWRLSTHSGIWGHLATARCNSSENCSSFGLSCASPPPLFSSHRSQTVERTSKSQLSGSPRSDDWWKEREESRAEGTKYQYRRVTTQEMKITTQKFVPSGSAGTAAARCETNAIESRETNIFTSTARSFNFSRPRPTL